MLGVVTLICIHDAFSAGWAGDAIGAKVSGSEDDLSKMAQLYIAGQTLSPVVFRFEPFILAVEARDMQAAQSFLQIARQAGFRESGATASGTAPQRVMIGIRCSIRLEVSTAGRRNGSESSRCTKSIVLVLVRRLPRRLN